MRIQGLALDNLNCLNTKGLKNLDFNHEIEQLAISKNEQMGKQRKKNDVTRATLMIPKKVFLNLVSVGSYILAIRSQPSLNR